MQRQLRAELRKRYLRLLETPLTDQQEQDIRKEIAVLEDKVSGGKVEKKRSWKKLPIKKNCLMCGKEFNTTRKYCGEECRNRSIRLRYDEKKTAQGNVQSGKTSPKK